MVICTGATKARDLPIPGRELKGIYMAMEFLRANTKSLLDSQHKDGNYISAKDKHVIVVGGGDTGTDCVGTSMRHGCKSLTQLEILPRPADSAAGRQSLAGMAEGLQARLRPGRSRGAFRRRSARLSDHRREIRRRRQAATSKRCISTTSSGPRTSRAHSFQSESPARIRVLQADLVLLAMGFLGPEDAVLTQLGVERDPRSNAKAEHGQFTTNVAGIFAAGDCRRGQSLVVWAINEGRGAARECDRYLMGASNLP